MNQKRLDEILDQEWKLALDKAEKDLSVGILHADVKGDASYRIHVASIPEKVGCHFHKVGDEDYKVVSGSGVLYSGEAGHTTHAVKWEEPMQVKQGDYFVIPEGYAHQLVRRGSKNLVILFGCPDTHLDDEQDRYLLTDCPAIITNDG